MLARFGGTWDVEHAYDTPDGVETSSGVDRVSTLHDGAWTWSDCSGLDPRAPYEGHQLLGWSPQDERFVSAALGTADLGERPAPLVAVTAVCVLAGLWLVTGSARFRTRPDPP